MPDGTPATAPTTTPTATPASTAPADAPFVMPDKFKGKSAEDIAKSYVELEKSRGRESAKPEGTPADAKPTKSDELVIEPKATASTATAADGDLTFDAVLTGANLKANDIATQWEKEGKLTDEQYKAIQDFAKSKGQMISKSLINAAVKSEQLEAKAETNRVHSAVAQATEIAGGEQQLKTLREWAATNIERSKLVKWGEMAKKDPGFYPDMIKLINAEYVAKNGHGPDKSLISGSGGGGGSGAVKNQKEFVETMNKAMAGDAAAMERIKATPQEAIDGWRS